MKPYTITFEIFPQYLYAYVEGKTATYDISKSYWTEILEKAKELNCNKILVYENIKNTVNLEIMYDVMMYLIPIINNTKIAFVDKELDQNALNEIGIYMIKNAGIDAGIFYNVDQARTWLLS
jgi:hypothetical protein